MYLPDTAAHRSSCYGLGGTVSGPEIRFVAFYLELLI